MGGDEHKRFDSVYDVYLQILLCQTMNEYQMRVGVVKVEICGCVVRFGEKKSGGSAPPACHNQRVKLYAFDLLSAKHLCVWATRARISVSPGPCHKMGMPLISLSAAVIGPSIFCTWWLRRGGGRYRAHAGGGISAIGVKVILQM